MRFALMIEPQQGLTYAEQLDIGRAAVASPVRAKHPELRRERGHVLLEGA